ncbi:hypothetical protein B0O80DRAFT_423509 [Mortierella sp. GBAus27b]|nr:hypothetical protein B0O80DRAFT_423509 [Mortierella sp. GBAus27b]
MATTLDIIIPQDSDNPVNVPYDDHEPISVLIQWISLKLGEKDDEIWKRMLYMNESPLRAAVFFGNVLTYRSTKKRKSDIHICILGDTDIHLEYKGQETVDQLLERIWYSSGVVLGSIANMYKYNLFFDCEKITLSKKTRGVKCGSVLHLLKIQSSGGVAPPVPGFVFADVSDKKGVRRLKHSKKAPPGRMVQSGTNVECRFRQPF